jgi:hypothetical protein
MGTKIYKNRRVPPKKDSPESLKFEKNIELKRVVISGP